MDAQTLETRTLKRVRAIKLVLFAAVTCLLGQTVGAAGFRTQNFIIQAPSPALARSVGEAAENYRDQLAEYWLGRRLPPWPTPCPIRVVAGPRLAAQGVTTYNRSPVRDFQMEVVGTPERILDSVLPHEVTHTVLATHFGRPLPRWADEGICTTVEHESERNKHEAKLREFLASRRGIAMNKLFLLTEYPSDVLPMYAQGYSVCRFLIEQQDARTFIAFLQDYMQNPSWTTNIKKHYGYDSLAQLQEYWLAWVSEGSGPVAKFAKLDPRGNGRGRGTAQPQASSVALASGQVPVASQSNPHQPNSRQPMTLNAPQTQAAATALTSVSEGGWYSRVHQNHKNGAAPPAVPGKVARRDQARVPGTNLAQDAIAPPPVANQPMANQPLTNQQMVRDRNQQPITPMMPPSVRNSGRYSSAQPQPEMGMSRGVDVSATNNWSNGPPRYR